MAETANENAKVIGEVPLETREEMDRLGEILDMKMGAQLREAIARTIPVWQKRAAERQRATRPLATPEQSTAGAGN